jgi:CubicO group peptidase (beta-lactamase class C family)
LVTHTAGFLYGFGPTPVDREYQKHVPLIPTAVEPSAYLAGLAKIPLAYEPGTQWQYSIAMDLEGIIVERLSGKTLQAFMKSEIFDSLKMVDTDFLVPPAKRDRFATLYDGQSGKLSRITSGPFADSYAATPVMASGGGGLVSTVSDYARFASMLLNGGTLGGKRIIADPAKADVAMGKGSYLWDGAAGTWFWVDPTNKIVFVGMIQRLAGPGGPNVQSASQSTVAASIVKSRQH